MFSVKKSLGILGSQRLFAIAISFISSVIIARYLTPQEIGVYSVCVSVVGIAHVFREFGVGNYLIQESELTRDRIRASLTILLTFSWILSGSLFLFKDAIAGFYHDPRLAHVFSVLALNFLIIPIAAPVLSVLRRNLEFGKSAIINLSGSTVQNGTAVTMAMLGFGPVSLAWGSFAGIVATITFSTYYRPKEVPWMPGLKDIGRVFSFGTKSSLSTVMNEAGYSAPDLIIGRMLTLGDVGLYSRASGVAALITDQIGMLLHGILFPAFSHENRTGANVKKNFLNRTELFNGLLCPALSFLGFAASPLILLLYGEKWLPAAPIASVICFSALISIPYNLTGSVLMAHGKVGFSAKMSFIVQSLNILSIFAGSLFGLIYIPIFGIVIYIGRFFVSRYAMNKFFGISAREVLAMNVKSFIVSGFALAPLVILRLILPQSTDVHIVIPAYLVSSAIFWLIGIYWTKHLLAQEITIVFESLMKKMAR